MINRKIYSTIKELINLKPAILITGARQVGKTTLCKLISEEYGYKYVSLADRDQRHLASTDPDMFIRIHNYPLIVDEIQYAPSLFDVIESIVDQERYNNPNVHCLFILTGSQKYSLMKNITQTMSGRIGIVNVPTISLSEELNLNENPFSINPEQSYKRIEKIDKIDFFTKIIKGRYPEILTKKGLTHQRFYSDYVDTYVMRDVSDLINVKDRQKFRLFMELIASLSGQILVYETITNSLGIDQKTVKSWLSVLEAGDIIFTLNSYFDKSVVKRVTKRPKIYFKDTGLACYLAKIPDSKILVSSYLMGPMVETFIVNEIIKTHVNSGLETPFFYYRDSNHNEIDLIMLYDGKLNMVECKSGMSLGKNDIKVFERLSTSLDKLGCIVCLCDKPYPITKEIYAIPLKSIGY